MPPPSPDASSTKEEEKKEGRTDYTSKKARVMGYRSLELANPGGNYTRTRVVVAVRRSRWSSVFGRATEIRAIPRYKYGPRRFDRAFRAIYLRAHCCRDSRARKIIGSIILRARGEREGTAVRDEERKRYRRTPRLKPDRLLFRGCDEFRHSAKAEAAAQRCSGRIFIMRGWGCAGRYIIQ